MHEFMSGYAFGAASGLLCAVVLMARLARRGRQVDLTGARLDRMI